MSLAVNPDEIEADDEFEDAYETQPMPASMDLETAMQESKVAVHLFFNNKFDEAWEMLRPWRVSQKLRQP